MAEEYSNDGMLEVFIYESEQLLENLQEIVLLNKDEEAFDETAINEIFRVMHTMKGSAGIMMFENIADVSHKLEDIFYYLRESHPENIPHSELVNHILGVADFIQGEIEKIKEGESPNTNPEKILKTLEDFLTEIKGGFEKKGKVLPPENTYIAPSQFYIAPTGASGSKYFKISIYYEKKFTMSNIRAYTAVYALKEIAEDIQYTPEDIISNEGSSDVILEDGFHILLQAQTTVAEIKKIISKGTGIERIEVYHCSRREFLLGFQDEQHTPIIIDLGEFEPSGTRKKEEEKDYILPGDYVIKGKESGKAKKLAKNQCKQPVKQNIISVNIEKMNALAALMEKLIIAEEKVFQNPDLEVPGLDLTSFHKAATQLSKITSELQGVIMEMRMIPLVHIFQKMNRMVYDISRKLDKDVELELIGEKLEVDKNIVEHISAPLMHLIRNALDHGIEDREVRIAVGKNPKGKITLEAKNTGDKIYVIVKDDGKGLNREAILKKARDYGLLGNCNPDEFSDKEVYQFITHPGFSTKDKVTEMSGRGVGMDVVVKDIQAIGGELEINSRLGEGTEMVLIIPLSSKII